MKVLIAEDNLVNQLLLRMYMNKLGWEFLIVENGLLAADACRTGDFDAILMDINMPELNGIGATEYIRTFNEQIPIIALTAFGDDTSRINCAEAGMNALIEKPVSINSVQEVVSELVVHKGLSIA
jgi:CheY-like chemotaxis protein